MPVIEYKFPGGDRFIPIEVDRIPETQEGIDEVARAAAQLMLADIEREENSQAQRSTGQREIADLNKDRSVLNQFLVGAGRGLTTVARGVGLADEESTLVREGIDELGGAATAGQITGEAAPFLIPGAAIGNIARGAAPVISTAARTAAGLGLGTAEGSILAAGSGSDTAGTVAGGVAGGGFGAGLEAIMPALSILAIPLFRQLGRKVPDKPLLDPDTGIPSPEFDRALKETNTSLQELTDAAKATIEGSPEGTNVEQLARASRFESQGISATQGDITQDFSTQVREARLVESPEAGAPLQGRRLEQSKEFEAAAIDFVKTLGVPADLGDNIKGALTSKKTLDKKEQRLLYKQLFEENPAAAQIPIFPSSIENAIPKPAELRRLSRLAGSQVAAVDDLLVEFGLNRDAAKVADFTGEITPLTLGNSEEFRQALNIIERADQTGAVQVFSGPIKNALDGQLEEINDFLQTEAFTNPATLAVAKEARALTTSLKTEFSKESIVGRLIGVKRDGITPIVEASKINNELLKPNAPIELLERSLKTLSKAEGGKRAIGDLQGAVVLNALENSLKAGSRKIRGERVFSGLQFNKSLDALGKDKVDLIFKGNKSALRRLRSLAQTASDIAPPAAAVPKGSASTLLSMASQLSRLPGLAVFRDITNFVVKAGAEERQVAAAINKTSAEFKRKIGRFEQEFPGIATAMGIPAGIAALPDDN